MLNKKVFLIKFIHSILFWLMIFCLFYILYCAISRTYDWFLLTAAGIIVFEGLSLVFNHWECPLTTLAEKYGAKKGSVTDIFLPAWCARNVFKFSTVLFTIEIIWLGIGYFS
jgi:hypothetical protein